MRAREGDDAHARFGENGVGEPAHNFRNERLRLFGVALGKAAVIGAVHEHELYFAVHRVGRGEGAQLVIVVHAVGEGDEALVLAAVMPQKVPLGHAEGEAVVQYALQILVFQIILVHIRRAEEGGGRQLLGIAHDDRRLRASNGADRLRRGHLRRLVEDDQVELIGDGLQILRHGGRAHQHAGADDAHERGDLAEQAPQPRAAQIALGKAGECAQFDGEAPLPVLRQAGDELGADMIAREAGEFLPRDAEFFDGLLKRADRHARERGVGGDVDLQEVAVDVLFKAREYVVRAEAPALQRLCDEVESEFGEFFARPAVHAPVGQQVDIVDERACLGGEVVQDVLFSQFGAIGVGDVEEGVLRVEVALRRLQVPLQHGLGVAARRADAHAVEGVRVVVHKDCRRPLVQVLEVGEKLRALFKVDAPGAVGKAACKLRVARDEIHCPVDIDERLQIFGDVLVFDGMIARALQLFDDAADGAVEPPVPCRLRIPPDFGHVAVGIDERLEVFIVVIETGVQPLIGVEEGIELRLIHAHEVLVVRSRVEPAGEFGERAHLAQRERGDLLPVELQKERKERLQVLDLGEHDLARAEHLVAQRLGVLGEVNVLEGRILHPAALLCRRRGGEDHALALVEFALGERIVEGALDIEDVGRALVLQIQQNRLIDGDTQPALFVQGAHGAAQLLAHGDELLGTLGKSGHVLSFCKRERVFHAP